MRYLAYGAMLGLILIMILIYLVRQFQSAG
jgi:tetrahydromethanopterin S-methyltransferase subunit G